MSNALERKERQIDASVNQADCKGVGATDISGEGIVRGWIDAFSAALLSDMPGRIERLFEPQGHWRDILALTWHFRTTTGGGEIERLMRSSPMLAGTRDLRIDLERAAPRKLSRAGRDVIEAILVFKTDVGRCSAVVRIDANAPLGVTARAWHLLTALEEIYKDAPDVVVDKSMVGAQAHRFGGQNWLDRRLQSIRYENREPTVLVVGGGQAGLMIAARLGQMNIDALIVDRMKCIGDNWRHRYHSLTLHNEVWVNHLPFMPFPENWPKYLPKDKLANWFASYVDAMEINFWTETEFLGASFDQEAKRWSVELGCSDGSTKKVAPRHVVMATGVSGIPCIPAMPGMANYTGSLMHSGSYTTGEEWRGRKTVVVGTGTSGHDVAQDLFSSGASVTIVQRSPTTVVSLEPSAQLLFTLYTEGPSTEDCDLLTAASSTFPVLKRGYQLATAQMKAFDQKLLEGLSRVGFKLDFGNEETGFQMKYLEKGGGYYINVGCSDLIVDGSIGLIQHSDIEKIVAGGLQLRDGKIVDADLIVMATGYESQTEVVSRLLGPEISQRIGPVWGLDPEGELRNMWKQTEQQGLWFIAGSLAQCRIYSKYLALSIQAAEAGKLPGYEKVAIS